MAERAVLVVAVTLLVAVAGVPVGPLAAGSATAQTSTPDFQITNNATNAPVEEGQTLSVAATINNTGGETGTQTVNLSFNGTVRDSTSVTLDPDEETTVGLSWQTQEGDKGTYEAEVATENDSATRLVEVTGNPQMVVQWRSSNAPITENETLNVSVKVFNVGDGEGSDVVELLMDGTIRDTREVNLSAGNSREVTLSWETGAGDAGEYNATVATRDHSVSKQLTVYDPGNYSVAIGGTNAPVFTGEVLVVNATVANRAAERKTKTVELRVNGTVRDSRSVSLGSGRSTNLSMEWATASGDAGNYTATVASPNASDSVDVSVRSRPGDVRLVHQGVYYRGQVLFTPAFAEESNVVVRHDNGTTVDTVRVGRDGVLVLDTTDLTAGPYGLYGEDTTRRFDLVRQTLVASSDRSAVTNRGANSSVELAIRSNRSDFDGVITSPQLDAAALDDVLVGIDGAHRDRDGDGTAEALVVPLGGETTTVADFTGVEAGSYTLQVGVADTPASAEVRVDVEGYDPPTATIEPATPTAGQTVVLEATVEGDSPVASYEWRVDGEVVSTAESLEYTFEEPGDHEVTLTVTDEVGSTASASRTIAVESAATPTDTATPTPTPTPTSSSGPGFGVLVALLALLAAVGASRRR